MPGAFCARNVMPMTHPPAADAYDDTTCTRQADCVGLHGAIKPDRTAAALSWIPAVSLTLHLMR